MATERELLASKGGRRWPFLRDRPTCKAATNILVTMALQHGIVMPKGMEQYEQQTRECAAGIAKSAYMDGYIVIEDIAQFPPRVATARGLVVMEEDTDFSRHFHLSVPGGGCRPPGMWWDITHPVSDEGVVQAPGVLMENADRIIEEGLAYLREVDSRSWTAPLTVESRDSADVSNGYDGPATTRSHRDQDAAITAAVNGVLQSVAGDTSGLVPTRKVETGYTVSNHQRTAEYYATLESVRHHRIQVALEFNVPPSLLTQLSTGNKQGQTGFTHVQQQLLEAAVNDMRRWLDRTLTQLYQLYDPDSTDGISIRPHPPPSPDTVLRLYEANLITKSTAQGHLENSHGVECSIVYDSDTSPGSWISGVQYDGQYYPPNEGTDWHEVPAATPVLTQQPETDQETVPLYQYGHGEEYEGFTEAEILDF